MTMVSVDLEQQLTPGTLEYAIHHVVEDHLNLGIKEEKKKGREEKLIDESFCCF
jgi:hypothetical protein